jgi:hypothetical protein
MSKAFLFLLFITIAFSSCRIPYNPDIDTDQQILVVDAFLTNHQGANHVRLTMAIPYDSAGNYPGVLNATVYLTDNTDSTFYFEETSAGYYEPADNRFAGIINKTYILTVQTPDGNTYVSNPETLLPEKEPSNVYGGYDQVEYLAVDYYGITNKVTEDVCAMYFDYIGDTTTPRFRYNSTQLIEYIIIKNLIYTFCCWTTETDNGLRFTNEKFASSSSNVYKQEVSFTPPNINIKVKDLVRSPNLSAWIYGESLLDAYEYKRIIEIKQYRLNNDSYQYYKEVEAQYGAAGKMFDPVISQLKGNITCNSVSLKPVFGFFEVSTLNTISYIIKRNGVGSAITLMRIKNVSPPSAEGFVLDQYPDFWVQ